MIDSTIRLINEHGVPVSLVRKSGKADLVSGERDGPEFTFPTHAVITRDENQGNSRTIDCMFSSEVEPRVDDIASIEGAKLTVTSVARFSFQGKPVYYEVNLIS